MYYFEINNGKVTGKGFKSINVLNDNEKEVTEELYNQFEREADFTTDETGNIISIVNGPAPAEEPKLPSLEERISAVEDALLMII
jgi:hypothetical protein